MKDPNDYTEFKDAHPYLATLREMAPTAGIILGIILIVLLALVGMNTVSDVANTIIQEKTTP